MMDKQNSKVFLLILLGMLSAFGPFVTDMYLPSLPSMTSYFNTNLSMVQLGLTTSMAGLAVGQLFFGPLSDKFGRRSPLLIAMLLFIASTVFCLYSTNIREFIFFRLIQGIAGSGGIVISRSVATDKYSGKELAAMLAVIGAINGIAPVAAPVLGGFLTSSVGWKGIFWVLFVLGLILLFCCFKFKESLPLTSRDTSGWTALFKSFWTVLHNRKYVYYVFQLAFAQGVLFSYISSSPFIIQQHYGFSPFAFSICFAINAVMIGLGAALSVKFRHPENSTLAGCIGMVFLSLTEFIVMYYECNFWIYEILLMILLFSMGLTFTSSTTLAMDSERKNAGTASALLGAICFAFGGVVSPLVGLGNIMVTTGLLFVICSFSSLICIRIEVRKS